MYSCSHQFRCMNTISTHPRTNLTVQQIHERHGARHYMLRGLIALKRHQSIKATAIPALGDGAGDGRPPGTHRLGGGGSGPEDDGHQRFSHGRHSALRPMVPAAAVFAVLVALCQPWRLLMGLPAIDTSSSAVSIIIPVLNEAGGIIETLQGLQQLQPAAAEVIVVDGGSTDGTVKLARRSGLAAKVVTSGRGRAVQMNAGAAAAQGDLLCFLHADTIPPRDLVSVMRRELRDPHTVLAGFVPSIEVPGRRLWLISMHNFISTYYAPLVLRPLSFVRGLRKLFGDQTMFCRACDFKAVGGFDPQWKIMEDVDLCLRMHEAGPCRHGSSAGAVAAARIIPRCSRGQEQQQPGTVRDTGSNAQDFWQRLHAWTQPRGRVKQVLDRVCVTSGRRLDAWGPIRSTYIHFVIAANWYFKRDPEELKQLYNRLYTDAFR